MGRIRITHGQALRRARRSQRADARSIDLHATGRARRDGWLVPISTNLILGRFFDIAVRDLTMAVGAYTLGALATLKGLAWLPGAPRAEEASIHAPTAR